MTRECALRCVDIFDAVRNRHGSVAAMREAVAYALAGKTVRKRVDAETARADQAVAALVEAVAGALGYTTAQLRVQRRRSIDVRDEVVHVVRALSPLASYPELGRVLRRDHASLVVGERRFERRLAGDELLRTRVARLVGAQRGEACAA